MTEPSQELVVLDRRTGELIDPKQAQTARLAAFVTDLGTIRQELSEAEGVVSDELVARCDAAALWTQHVESGGQAWEIKTSSPTAGTEVYLSDVLETELRGLVDAGTIKPEAAARALRRRVVLEFDLPWGADAHDLTEQVKRAPSIEVAGVEVEIKHADARIAPVMAGINALRKVAGTAAALDAAKREQPQGRRKATVKMTGGES